MSIESKHILKENQMKCRDAKNFLTFLLHSIKNGTKSLTFGKDCINKNAFHKNGKPVSIDEVFIRNANFRNYLVIIHMLAKLYLNTLLDI